MMRTTKILLASAICAAMLFAGCSEKGGEDGPETYTVTVTSDGNGTASPDKTTATAGATVTLTADPANGYSFKEWSAEGLGFLPGSTAKTATFTMPARNVSIKAEFAAVEYTVTVTSGGNGAAEADKESAAEGATVMLTATPTTSGYGFDKWTVESGGAELLSGTAAATNPVTFTMPAGDVSVKAEFVVSGTLINGTIWAYCNVDAPGTFAAKPEDAGMFYQWNRKTGWSSSDPLTSSPAGATWDSTDVEGDEWAAVNDPCPAGWRVPTHGEQVALFDNTKTIISQLTILKDVNGRWVSDKVSGNSVFLPAAGERDKDSGAMNIAGQYGEYGEYWSATPNSYSAFYLVFSSSLLNSSFSCGRSYGLSVRCVAK